MMREKMTPQRVWQEFTRAQNFNNAIELYETVEQNEDFYIGNQWRGVNAPNLDHPVMNMLCRVVKFFISSVMSDDIGISVTDFDESSAMKPVLDMLGVQFDQIMEGSMSTTARSHLEIHMSADAMTLDEFYALMTDAEATKKITLQNIDAENPEKEYTNIYADFTYPRSIGKQCVTKVNYATGEPAEEVHLVASLEQLTFVEQQLAALGL